MPPETIQGQVRVSSLTTAIPVRRQTCRSLAARLTYHGIMLGTLYTGVALGATPTKINFERYASTEEGKKYAIYTVRCSNGEARRITAWDNRRDWCVSHQSRDACHRWQLAAARQACGDQ